MPSNQTNINIGVKYNVDQSSVNAVKKSLQDIQNIKPSNFSGTITELRQIQNTAHLVETALHDAFNVNLNSLNVQAFNQQLKTAGLTVDQVYQQFSKVGAQGQVAFSQMATSILTTNLQLKQTKSLMTSMGETMMNTVKWGIASSVMNNFTNSVRQAFQYAQSLNGALTDIRIVTGDSTEQMRQFAKQANSAAQNLGRSTMDYTKAALSFYQQGLSDEQVQTRTQTVLKAQNITGAGQEMADYLTAVWNGYKVANQEAELYVDKLAAVADSSASNMSQLAVAMSKVASTANAMGVPVDNLNAQIATIVATTRQAPESVGNALKTIYARINDISTGAEDAQVSLGNYSKQMASVGFNVLDANGNLRDTGDVIDEIGGKWQTLSREQQIYLARTMAGQRQYNNLIALFDNWGKYTDLVNVSMEAQGTTMQKNARYMDSLGAKMEQFGAASEKVKDALINEEDLKDLFSSLTSIISLFGSLIESIGGGGNALLAFGGIITQLFSNTIAKEINNAITNIQNAKSNLQAINTDRQNIETFLQSQGYKDGVIKETLQAKDAAQQYYKYMSTAQINEHNQLIKNIAAAKQDVLVLNERRDAAQAFAKSFVMSKISKGTAGFSGTNINEKILSEDFQEVSGGALLTIEALQSKISKIDFSSPAQSLDKLKTIYQELRNQIGNKPLSLLDGADRYTDTLNKIKDAANPTETEVNKVRIVLKNLLEEANSTITDAGALKQLRAQADEAQRKLTFAQKASQQYLKNIQQFSNVKTFVNMTAGLGQVASGINNIVNLTKVWKNENLSSGEKILQTFTNLSMTIPMLVNGFTKIKDGIVLLTGKILTMSVAQGANTGMTIAQIAAQQGLAVALQQVAVAAWSAIAPFAPLVLAIGTVAAAGYLLYKSWNQEKQAAQKAAKAAQEAKQKYDDVKTSFDELKSSIENYHNAQDAIKNLTKGTQEWRDAIKESNDQVLQLLDKYPQLAAYVSNVNGQLQISEKGFDTLIKSQSKALLQAQAESIKTSNESREADLKKMAADIGHESAYIVQGYAGGSLGFASSQQVLAVAQALNNLGDFSASEETLAEQVAEQTNLSIEIVSAILQHKDSLIALGAQIDSNTQASKLMYEQVAKENLSENEQYQNLSKEQQSITESLIAKKLAQADSVEEVKKVLDNLNVSIQEATVLFNRLQNAIPENNREAMQKLLTGQNFSGLSKQQLQNLNPYDQQTRKFFDENYSQFGYKDGYDFQQAFIASQQEALAEYEQIVQNTTGSVKKYFKELNNSAISVDYAKTTIKEDLEKALVEGGQAGVASLTNFYNKVKDTSKLDEVVQSFNFTEGSAEELKQALNKAGAATGLTVEELEAYIAVKKKEEEVLSADQAYNNIHSVIDKKNGKKLEYNDEIDPETYNKLKEAGVAVEGAFQKVHGGMYRFIGDAEQFYKQANQVSLQPYYDQIDKLKSKLQQLQSGGQLSASQLANYNQWTRDSTGEWNVNYDVVQKQVDALYGASLISDEELSKYNDLIEMRAIDSTSLQEIKQKIQDNQSALQEYIGKQQESTREQLHQLELQQAFSQQDLGQLRDLRNREDQPLDLLTDEQYIDALIATADAEGLVKENIEALAEQLASSADELQNTNDNLKDHRKECYEVAAAAQDLIVGIEGIQKAWKETTKEQVEAAGSGNEVLAQTTALLSDMFNQDIGEDFVTKHLAQVERIAQGDLTAVQDLGVALGLLRINEITIPTWLDRTAFDTDVANLQNQIQGQDWGQIQFGATIDGADFYNALQSFIIESGATQEQINKILAGIGYDPNIEYLTVPLSQVSQSKTGSGYVVNGTLADGTAVQQQISEQFYNANATADNITIPIIKGSKFVGGAGNLGRVGGSRTVPKAPSSSGRKGGGGGGKGGKSSAPKPGTQAKLSNDKIEIKDKTPDYDPYQQEQKAQERQQKILDKLQEKEKRLTGKDRLKNLNQQNKALEKQNKIIQKQLEISDTSAEENSTKNYAERLRKFYGDENFSLDSDKQISDENKLREISAQRYNKIAKESAKTYKEFQAQYNNYIENTWNKYNSEQQERHKVEKQQWDDRLKEAKDAHSQRMKNAQEEYNTGLKLIDAYDKAWEEDQKRREQQEENRRKIIENNIEKSKIKVDLTIETGEAERDWLDFENKFIKKIDKDDFLGNAKASFKEITSYFNSNQIQQTANQISTIQEEIKNMRDGKESSIYGDDIAQAEEDLEEYRKKEMDNLKKIQDLVDDIKENYLNALDDAKDKMDDQIDQYERVNDLIEHNVKLVQLLYGDKAYDTMNKYYEMQRANNNNELQSLRMQQQYWQNFMANEEQGSDAWKKAKENVDDITDKLNSKLEEMIQNLSDQWENRVNGIIAKLNNALTGGRGLDYVDEEWDFINNYDDHFLDTFESKFGVDQVTRLYQEAIDGLAGSPANQQKINKLMNDQLKILREKDKLTQYDIDRAKAALEVEKARMALEDSRYNKTKMRLRRDSQGNYTYQYVADEQKLSELQAALADAQANLYNMDKQHYKETLNDYYSTYKDFIKRLTQLQKEYNDTQDKEERARIKNRIDILKKWMGQLEDGLSQDNKYNFQYLTSSFMDGMGLNMGDYTEEELNKLVTENVPQAQSSITELIKNINGEGGLLNATKDSIAQINNLTQNYDKDIKEILKSAGTGLTTIGQVTDANGATLDKNIQSAQNLITTNKELIKSCDAQIKAIQTLMSLVDQYLNKAIDLSKLVANLRSAYNTSQQLNESNLTADEIPITGMGLDTTAGVDFTGNPATDMKTLKKQIDTFMSQYQKFLAEMAIATFDTGGATGTWGDASGRLAFLHEKELVLNQQDTFNILAAVEAVRAITSSLNGLASGEVGSIINNATGLLSGINTNESFDQNVHIEANFPNVTQHTEIEQAFENLVNMASMRAASYKR